MNRKRTLPLFSFCVPSFADVINFVIVTIFLYYVLTFLIRYLKNKSIKEGLLIFLARPFMILIGIFTLLALGNFDLQVFVVSLLIGVGFYWMYTVEGSRMFMKNTVLGIIILFVSIVVAMQVPQIIGRPVHSVLPTEKILDCLDEGCTEKVEEIDQVFSHSPPESTDGSEIIIIDDDYYCGDWY